MSISRRLFLRSGALTAVAAGMALGTGKLALAQKRKSSRPTIQPVDGVPYRAQQDTLFSYRRAAFEPCVGSVFQTRGADGKTINLTLISVTEYKSKAPAGLMSRQGRETDSFTLGFKADGMLPGSGIPELDHPVLGKFDMFLTLDRENGELFYEAVVNHVL
jgi:hypothetical protein